MNINPSKPNEEYPIEKFIMVMKKILLILLFVPHIICSPRR